MSLTRSGSVSVSSDCNADILGTGKEGVAADDEEELGSIPHARDLL